MTIKHYVEFDLPGIFVPESEVRQVKQRDVVIARPPKNCFAYRFYDRRETVLEGETLTGKRFNISPRYIVGGTWYTLAALKKHFPNEAILISNIEMNDYVGAIKCHTGNWQGRDKSDILLDVEEVTP